MKVLVTGAAGFIGYHCCADLLAQGYTVVGVDNLCDYYDVSLKTARIKQLELHPQQQNFRFYQQDICDTDKILSYLNQHNITAIINLAAQAGVRYSITNPKAYLHSNLEGFLSILEATRACGTQIQHLVYASSSSVYGLEKQLPFSEQQTATQPISLYGATKRANELMAHSYSYLYAIPSTGLRFFTVYGPWGRPDMALFKFTQAILADKPIDVFNNGEHVRDFTYVDDIVMGIRQVLLAPPKQDTANWQVFNIGNQQPTALMQYIELIENYLNKKAKINFLPMQAGDVKATAADVGLLFAKTGYKPSTTIEFGVKNFIAWYLDYYKCNVAVCD